MNRPNPPAPKHISVIEQRSIDRQNRAEAAAYGLLSALRAVGVTDFDKVMHAANWFVFSGASGLGADRDMILEIVKVIWERNNTKQEA